MVPPDKFTLEGLQALKRGGSGVGAQALFWGNTPYSGAMVKWFSKARALPQNYRFPSQRLCGNNSYRWKMPKGSFRPRVISRRDIFGGKSFLQVQQRIHHLVDFFGEKPDRFGSCIRFILV